ncbi:hypothetical protein [Lacisediminihabitans sp. H27-G8]|uniref:hypothetical protein n=1 Tax=Lacisediminihabitans sp. H27-G8 TaxID=3111909 RepID=UPI0038FC25B0
MGFFDRLFGREDQAATKRPAAANRRSDDEIAVERYEYLLRTAPPETIEKVHTEAFSKLTPQQRDILFEKLTANADANSDANERPADAAPATLAKAATRAELQQPGTLTRTLGGSALGGAGGVWLGGMFASSLLGSVAGYVIGSALVSSFMPMDGGSDASAADANGTDAGASDSGTSDAGAADSGAADSGGWDGGYDSGGDFGGDFGGGDFGGF